MIGEVIGRNPEGTPGSGGGGEGRVNPLPPTQPTSQDGKELTVWLESQPFKSSTVEVWLDRMSALTGFDMRPVGLAMVRINRRWESAVAAGDAEGQARAEVDAELLVHVMYPTLPAHTSTTIPGGITS